MIDAAYLLGPLRPFLLARGMPSPVMFILDLSVLAGTGFLAETAARLASRKALRHLFRKLLPPEQANKIKPQAGTVGLSAYLGAALIFVLAVIGAAFTGHAIPDWAHFLMVKAGLL